MISYKDLLEYLKELDNVLEWKIKLIAVGGTPITMILIGLFIHYFF